MAGCLGRCAQNCKKIVQKIIQNIRPSQMAFYMGSPEGEKLEENLIHNYTKYKGSAPEGVTWMDPIPYYISLGTSLRTT